MTGGQRELIRRIRSKLAFAELEAAGGYWRSSGRGPVFCIGPIEAKERQAEREMLRAITTPDPERAGFAGAHGANLTSPLDGGEQLEMIFDRYEDGLDFSAWMARPEAFPLQTGYRNARRSRLPATTPQKEISPAITA